MDLFDLTGQVAIVTGSTKGIGRAIAAALARAGARVVISSRREENCERVASQLSGEGLDVIPIPCHIGKRDHLERLVSECEHRLGPVDCLVCNAAVNPYFGPLSEVSDEVFSKTIDSNVRSNLWLCNLVIPGMAERKGGSVIFVASIVALQGSVGLAMYGISKAAAIQMVKNLAVQWGPDNVRVNSIVPGLVRTDFSKKRYRWGCGIPCFASGKLDYGADCRHRRRRNYRWPLTSHLGPRTSHFQSSKRSHMIKSSKSPSF